MRRLLREPLLHFLLFGAGIFGLYSMSNQNVGASYPQIIVVNRDNLLTYIQYRFSVLDSEDFNELLDTMPQEKLDSLVKDYVREEALYREAKALQLDKNDYLAKQRLVQQLEYLTRGFMDTVGVDITDDEIEVYYKKHQSDYHLSPKVTFTHVFFDQAQRSVDGARKAAQATLAILNGKRVRFDQAPGYGDRFYYFVNYISKGPEEVASYFGHEMWNSISELEPSDNTWHGPFQSSYGFHLVMLTQKTSGRIPQLTEIRGQVEADVRQEKEKRQFDAAIQSIVDNYVVDMKVLRADTKLTGNSATVPLEVSNDVNGVPTAPGFTIQP